MSGEATNSTLLSSPVIQSNLFCPCTDPSSIVQVLLIVIIMAFSIVGNGVICILLVRFRTLRTVPNILVVNLAFVDIINALINMPLFILWYLCQVTFLKGRQVSLFVVSFYVLSMFLTVVSLLVLMLDRYGAIVHGLRYHAWKTRNKAIVAVIVIWIAAGAYTFGMFSLGIHIDVGDKPVWVYRIQYFSRFGRSFLIPGYFVPFGIIMTLGFLIWRTVRMSRIQMVPRSSMGKRTRSDIQTAKTLGVTILTYFWMGIFPVLLHSVARFHGSWPHFLAYFFIHMNSMANPIIYSLRTQRFRRAFILLVREPCGNSQPTVRPMMTSSAGMTTCDASEHREARNAHGGLDDKLAHDSANLF